MPIRRGRLSCGHKKAHITWAPSCLYFVKRWLPNGSAVLIVLLLFLLLLMLHYYYYRYEPVVPPHYPYLVKFRFHH